MPENMLGFPGNPGMLGDQEEEGLPGMLGDQPRSLERLRQRVTEAGRYASLPYSERHPEMPGLGFTEQPTAMQMLSMRLASPMAADRAEGVRDVLTGTVDAVLPAGLGAMAWQAMKGNRAMPPISGTFGGPAFHGSPHRFDKFDINKIGTGEGAQAYGHGLYFAESPGVARSYVTAGQYGGLHPRSISLGKKALKDSSGDIAKAREALHDIFIAEGPDKGRLVVQDAMNNLDEISKGIGNLYEVDIPDDQISQMLDWDKPLSEQPEAARLIARDMGFPEEGTGGAFYKELTMQKRDYSIAKLDDYNVRLKALSREMDADSGPGYRNFRSEKGRRAAKEYDRLMDERSTMVPVGSMDLEGAQKAASEELREVGIPGLRYLDQASRDAGKGTRNLVLFSDENIKILKRDGKAVAAEAVAKRIEKDTGAAVLLRESAPDTYGRSLVNVDEIYVPPAGRGQGTGTKALEEITSWADSNGKHLVLNADSTIRGAKGSKAADNRLIGWYKRHGFVRNTGRNKDFTLGGPTQKNVMYREPR